MYPLLLRLECKWSKEAFDVSAIKLFRQESPQGLNICVAANVDKITKRRLQSLEIIECSPWQIGEALQMEAKSK